MKEVLDVRRNVEEFNQVSNRTHTHTHTTKLKPDIEYLERFHKKN